MQNITLMKSPQNETRVENWLEAIQAHGAYSFPLKKLEEEMPSSSTAIKQSLGRLVAKGKVLSIHKGFYLIIPPQYASLEVLPPSLFIDALMKHLERPYYVSLLSAALYHGAAHQQPQVFFVTTRYPVLRPTHKKGLMIRYLSINHIPEDLLEKRKTEAGYMNISNPALTACDLVQFEKRVGGLGRAGTVINELMELIKPDDFSPTLLLHTPVSALQRLGYMLEFVCENQILADALFEAMDALNLRLFRIPLKTVKKSTGFLADNRWNVIVNTTIEIDE